MAAISQTTLSNAFSWIKLSTNISLKFVPKGPINNIQALVQMMAWRRSGDKTYFEPMMVRLLSHICVTRPQWVKHTNAYDCDLLALYVSVVSSMWDGLFVVECHIILNYQPCMSFECLCFYRICPFSYLCQMHKNWLKCIPGLLRIAFQFTVMPILRSLVSRQVVSLLGAMEMPYGKGPRSIDFIIVHDATFVTYMCSTLHGHLRLRAYM